MTRIDSKPSQQPVTVVGLGMMGSALAGALLDSGHPTTVWNRTAAKADDLISRGATRAGTVTEAMAASPVVIVCVLDNDVVASILSEASDVIGGRTVVNLTNGTPAQATELATLASEQDVTYIDGGIMATPPMIGGPDAYVFYSGPAIAVDACLPVLERFGGVRYVGEDPGLAALHDLALLSGMYGMMAGWFHALALVRSAGISAVEFTSLLAPWLDAMATYLPPLAQQVDEQDGVPDDAPLTANAAALANIAAASRGQDVRDELLTPLHQLFVQGADAGAVNFAELVELLRTAAG